MAKKVGRNDPCPCASGKKYKRCCLPREEVARLEAAQLELWSDDEVGAGERLDEEPPDVVEADDAEVVLPPLDIPVARDVTETEPRASPSGPSEAELEALARRHRQQGGTCALCGTALRRGSVKRHMADCAPRHDRGASTQSLAHLRVTAPGLPAYWLDVEVRLDTPLEALDDLLRATWVECCGHLSLFRIGAAEYFSPGCDLRPAWADLGLSFGQKRVQRSMKTRLAHALPPEGGRFAYEYDFGSTTHLEVKVIGERTGGLGRARGRLLARNTSPDWPCADCGRPASRLCPSCWQVTGNPFLCTRHARPHVCDEGEALLPVVNSPRMGVCGYSG